MKTGAKFYTPIQERLVPIADANSEYIKMKGCRWRLRLKFMDQFMKISHMRAANDLARLHICAVSPEPSLIALKRRDVNEGSGRLFLWFMYLSHMRAVKDQASLHICTVSPEPSLIALERRDIDEGFGQIVYTSYVI